MEIKLSNPVQLARVGLFLCGVGGIVLTTCSVLPESAERIVRSFFNSYYYTQLPVVISMLVSPVVSYGVSGYLIAKCDRIASGMFPSGSATSHDVERAIYRVVLTAVAILIFAETMPHFIHAFGMTIIEQYEIGELIQNEGTFSRYNAPYLISFVFKLIIAFYLLIGAPYLVEWQMDRSQHKEHVAKPFQFRLVHLLVLMALTALALGLLANGLSFRRLVR